MPSMGELVDKLLHKNIEIWHKDTLVRNNASIPLEEKAKLFLDARILNTERNELRDEIDALLGKKMCSRKVNYFNEKI